MIPTKYIGDDSPVITNANNAFRRKYLFQRFVKTEWRAQPCDICKRTSMCSILWTESPCTAKYIFIYGDVSGFLEIMCYVLEAILIIILIRCKNTHPMWKCLGKDWWTLMDKSWLQIAFHVVEKRYREQWSSKTYGWRHHDENVTFFGSDYMFLNESHENNDKGRTKKVELVMKIGNKTKAMRGIWCTYVLQVLPGSQNQHQMVMKHMRGHPWDLNKYFGDDITR